MSTLRRQIVLGVSLFFAVSTWYYIDRILIPQQKKEAAVLGQPRGNLSDLYPRWVGARELLRHGVSPYSVEVTRASQLGYYGRGLDPSRPGDPKDQQAFAYPVYIVLLLAPTVYLPFSTVQTVFHWLLLLLTLASIILWLRAFRYRLPPLTLLAAAVLVLGSLPVAQGIKLQQLTLAIAALLAASLAALSAGYLAIAGALLAMATVKPQIVFLAITWLAVWCLGEWRKRQRLAWAFLASMALLIVGGELLLPRWPLDFLRAVAAYQQYAGAASVLQLILGAWGGTLASLLLLAAAVAIFWRVRRAPAGSPAFALAIAVALAITLVVIPKIALYNQVLLLPGLLVLFHMRAWFWGRKAAARFAYAAVWLLVAWSWLATAGITVARLAVTADVLQSRWRLPFYSSGPMPLAVAAVLLAPLLSSLRANSPDWPSLEEQILPASARPGP